MNTKLQIIGLGGTNGAGKDVVGLLMAEKYGYLFISVTDLLRAEATRRREPVEREVLRTISAEWRRESGLGVLIEKGVAEYELVKHKHVGVVMASLRNPGEADRVHELGGTVVWIDADPRIRYDRIQANAEARNRVEEDRKTYEQFLVEEEAEMHSSGDAATLNMNGVKGKSDIFLTNDSSDLDTLEAAIVAALGLSIDP
jgi:dephospho-CoA kinase